MMKNKKKRDKNKIKNIFFCTFSRCSDGAQTTD